MTTSSLSAAQAFFGLPDLGSPLFEAWGDFVDPRERIREDAEFMGFGRWSGWSRIEDREDGKFLPIYETEEDLRLIRGQCRNLALFDAIAIGASESLANYVLGKAGFDFVVKPAARQEISKDLLGRLQALVDLSVESLGLKDEFGRELHARSREDGEAFARLEFSGGKFDVETIEPDQVVQPANPRPIEDWIGCSEEFVSSWSFGVHTKYRQPHSPCGYHVVYDGAGRDWDYIPDERMIRIKRNTYRNAKRGVSDYFPVLSDMRAEAKLGSNMATGAALQAAIAWIEEHPTGTTQGQVNSLSAGLAEGRISQPTQANPGGQKSFQRYSAGTILRPSPGKLYKPGPMGSERNKDFVEVAGYVIRRIGIRWVFPEYMISGDASNANFSSTLVAESPFVKARESDQAFYASAFKDAVLKALRMAFDANLYGIHDAVGGESWETLRRLFDVKVMPPAVATRDIATLTTALDIQARRGWISNQTASTQLGLNYDEELSLGAKPDPVAAPGLPMFGSSADALQRTIESVFEGYP